jgi:ABC-type antimicrobial peptide transport system permease subunit
MGGALSGVFGLLALSLASLGMYGVMAYTVNLRQREMGVRLALGAEPRKVVRLVLRDGLRLVSIGIAVGLSGAVAIATVLSRLLHGISPVEPLSLLGGTALLAGVAFIACYLPARRVSRLEPVSVLRAN